MMSGRPDQHIEHNVDPAAVRRELMEGRLLLFDALDAALDRYPEVLAVISASGTRSVARTAVADLLKVDELFATGVLDLHWSDLRADRRAEIAAEVAELRRALNA